MDAVPDATTYYQVIDNAGGTLSNSDLVGNDPCVDFELFGCGQYIIEAIDTSSTCTNCEVRDTIYPYYCCEIFVTFQNDTVLCDGTLASSTATATGGDGGPYTYLWSDAQTTNPAVQLDTGDYILEVTDFIGCVDSFYTTIVAEEDCEVPCDCLGGFTVSAACDRVDWWRIGTECSEYEQCNVWYNGVNVNGGGLLCNGFFGFTNPGDVWVYELIDDDGICPTVVSDTLVVNCVNGCTPCSGMSLTQSNCVLTSNWSCSQTGWTVTWLFNSVPFTPNISQFQHSAQADGLYQIQFSKPGCPTTIRSQTVTGCPVSTCPCADPIPVLSVNNCVASWNDTYCDYNVSLQRWTGTFWTTVATSPTFTITVDGDYRLQIVKAGCSVIFSNTVSVTGCLPVDCTGCTNPIFSNVGCQLSYDLCTNGWASVLRLNGNIIAPSGGAGSHTAILDGTYTVTYSKAGCTDIVRTLNITGCTPPPDCTGCINPTVSFVNCNVTHTICTNGWIATIYLQGTNTVVDSDNDGSFTASDGVAYDVRWEKAGCTTIQQGFTTTCPTVDCTGCANPTVSVNGCDVTHTVCTNGWVANIYLQSNGSLVDSDNDGFFTGQNGINYIIRWTKPGCGTNLQVFSTSCTIVCTDCPNPTATSDDDCMVSYTDCPGRTVLVNGLAPTSNPFQGAPNTTYNFTWSKAGCPDETASVTTDPPTADIDFGDPVVTFECLGVGTGAVVVSFPDFTADCVCCEDLTLVVWANSIINGTTSTQVYSQAIQPCSGDPVEVNAVGLNCFSPIYPITYQFFYGPTRFEINPNNCGLTVDFGGVSNTLTVTQAMADNCCVNGLSDMIGDPIDAEELQMIRQQEIQKNKNQKWPFMACVLFAILILFGASSIYKPK